MFLAAFTDADFLRLWKGLFYCMWMSDKPLIQENLADEIASLVQCFEDLSIALQYFGAFLETMSIEWFGIDNWRIDKFMMVRNLSKSGTFSGKCSTFYFAFSLFVVVRVRCLSRYTKQNGPSSTSKR